MKTPILLLSFLCLSLTSCLDAFNNKPENLSLSKDFNIVTTNETYNISIPKYMDEASDLNDEASLQYQNMLREAYVIVIDEPKGEFIEGFKSIGMYSDSLSVIENYSEVQLSAMKEGIEILGENPAKSYSIAGLAAVHSTFDGRIDEVDEDITYHLTFIEGKDNIYMVMAWTLKSKKQKLMPTYDQIANSFRLIKKND